VIEAYKRRIRAGRTGRDKMKILVVTRQVWLGNIREQLRCRWIDAGNLVVEEQRVGNGIVEPNRGWLIQQGGEVAVSFGKRRHGGEDVIGIRTARAAVVPEEKCLCSSVIDVRNIQRSADGGAKVVSVIGGFVFRLSGKRERRSVKDGAVIGVEERA